MSKPTDNPYHAVRYSSLLVITHDKRLIRLRCPFSVLVLNNFQGTLEVNTVRQVEYVQYLPNLPYFRLSEGLYPCVGFAIVI